MSMLQSLRHVASAVRHAEVLADEAEDLEETALATRLRARGRELAADLERAVEVLDDVEPARQARAVAHEGLGALYGDVTMRLEAQLSPERASRLSPGGHLDVVERARFRFRHLAAHADERLAAVREEIGAALARYDAAVDAYLIVCAEAQSKKDEAVVKSQALRLELERVKQRLLLLAPAGGEAWRRIKRRAVRTKRARWLDAAKARHLLGDVYAATA
ncbi:MAG: hypothetical protein A2138_14850 [Deltaproteobacteria bacterium RBG_16_71_12]|nr:MAG: hypothetical protein A2138_14850 [Deltaproteobacteria bacterium RBG_16_71_12]